MSSISELNTYFQKRKIALPIFEFTTSGNKFSSYIKLNSGTVITGDYHSNKKMARDDVAKKALSILKITNELIVPQIAPVIYKISKYSGILIIDGDNITDRQQLSLLEKLEQEGTEVIFVVLSCRNIGKLSESIVRRVHEVPNVGKEAVDLWITAYIAKYNFSLGSEITIISQDHFADTLSKLAPMFHKRPLKVFSHKSIYNFLENQL